MSKSIKQDLKVLLVDQNREELYRTLARNIPKTAVLLFNRDFRYTLADGMQLTRHGFSQEMFEGKTLWEVFPPEISEEWAILYSRALDGEIINFEQKTEDGYLQIYVVPVKNECGEIFAGMAMWQDISERKLSEDALAASEEKYRDLFENANDIIYVHDLQGNYISANRAAVEVFGYTREEIFKMNMKQVVKPDHLKTVKKHLTAKLAGAKESTYEIECITKCGRIVSLEINSRAVYENGKPVAIQGIARDITERKRTEVALKESESRFRDLFENANDLIYTHDLKGNFTSLNRAGELITGYTRQEATRLNIAQVVAPEYLKQARGMIARKLTGESSSAYELEIITKQGNRVTLELSTQLILVDGKPVGVQGIARDITERKRVEEKLQYNALYDLLTNLPNRAQFMKHLERSVEMARRDSCFKFAVLFLDLDRFKVINDGLGHVIGDKLLIAIAKRLEACVRPGDIVARLGGDEFTILLNNIEDVNDAVQIAERLQRKLSAPFKLDNYEVFTSASIGIIVSDKIERKPEDFLRDADTAMYRAKEAGKARYEIFDREMHIRNMNLLKVETDLRHAIERNELQVYYQPIVRIDTGEISEFEALIRWQHPEYGLVSPNEFIGIAEETGLIIPVGKWVVEEACRQTILWQKQFGLPNLAVSANLSAKQLMHPALTAQVMEILDKTGLATDCLKLEVTETMVMENPEAALGIISELNDLGVRFSTDDFGTGFSSLSYLHRFPFERLKIDRSFITKMDEDAKSQAIVRTIVLLGQNLGIETVAEGIENSGQLNQLRSLDCHFGQGYLFSRPLTAKAAEILLRDSLEEESSLIAHNCLIGEFQPEEILTVN